MAGYLQFAWGGLRLRSLPRLHLRHMGIAWDRRGRNSGRCELLSIIGVPLLPKNCC